ncbi:MAG: carboxypeptidase regulatory-like domain-containing protein, partial [Xanthomonadales bacterium]|nr:carboxypeptidase regulatory-like domain-containing protein [Xanthomonadales bacterium]
MIDCTLAPSDGYYTVNSVEVTLNTYCRNATELRLSESQLFGGATYSPLTPNRSFTLSPTVGPKRIYGQFRGQQGQTAIAFVDLTLQGEGPQVQITAPSPGTIITEPGALLDITALATDVVGVEKVQFYVNGSRIATDTSPPYATQFDTTGRPNGFLGILAVATNVNQATSTATVSVEVRRPEGPGDTSPPIISNLRFDGDPLENGYAFTNPGLLTATIVDDGLVAFRQLKVNGIVVSTGTQQQSTFAFPVTFDKVPNGEVSLELTARDQAGNQTSVTRVGTLMLAPPAIPEILYPTSDLVVRNSRISVLGNGNIGNRIQLYLDDQPIGQPVPVGINGSFSATIDLATDGPHTLSADASNSVSTSPRSAYVPFSYEIPPPSIIVTSPPAGALVSSSLTVGASVIDQRAGTNVEFFIDDVSVGIDHLAPFSLNVDTTAMSEGVKTVRALLRNASPETSEATSQFLFRRTPVPPQPFVPPYVASGMAVSPITSSGNLPITISGRLREALTPASVPNAALSLLLRTNGFDRRVNLVSDSSGNFSYTYTPLSNDEGSYTATAMHPDATPFVDVTPTGVVNFTINRLSVTKARIGVAAARGFPQVVPITVRNSVGTLAQGVRLVARPEDQPSGSLPAGISFDDGGSSGIASGGEHTFNAVLSSELSSAPSGNLVVAVLEDSSGNLVRARTRIDYELFPATPSLIGSPVSVYTGVRRGEAASESFELRNKGLVVADGVRAELVPGPSGTVPSWISLVSAPDLGSLAVGERHLLELRFAPGSSVVDGVYEVKLRVTASNAQGGDFFVTVAVSEAGEAQARFHIVDNFTGTLDANNQPILGLTGARVSIQNEANANIRSSGTTGTDGMVTIGPLPPGRYRYQATAPGHAPASGRVILRPGITIEERAFLDVAAVSFTWSVTPTTIADNYNVVLSAVYSTIVPAPVVILEPTSVNIPPMSVGEFITGEFTIINRGLLRADEVAMTLPQSNAFYDID